MYSAALPVASVAILFVMYTVLARLLPRFLSVVTGERSAKLTSKIGDSVPGADGHSSNYLDWRARRNNRPAQAS